MALSLNLYRRGGVYWWRSRFAGPDQASFECALSLCTYEPGHARQLGLRLSIEAVRLRRRIKAHPMDIAEIKQALLETKEKWAAAIAAEIVEPVSFVFEDQAIADLDQIEEMPWIRRGSPFRCADLKLHPSQEQLMLAAASISDDEIHRASQEARSNVQFDADGFVLGIDRELNGDAIMSCVYRLVAYRGAGARLTQEDLDDLVRDGRTPFEIETIAGLLRDAALRETRHSWALGPDRREIETVLIVTGIAPTIEHVHAIRRIVLLRRAMLLDRLAVPASRDANAAAPTASAVPLTAPIAHVATAEEPDFAPSTSTDDKVEEAKERPSFITLSEDFITKKTHKNQMGQHTQRQYRSLAALFVKISGTDDPNQMKQAHIGKFFDILSRLPKSYGKSPADRERPIADIITNGEKLAAASGRPRHEMIGLDAGTINRHATQLKALLKYSRTRGYTIGDLDTIDDERERDPESACDKRTAFDAESSIVLFSSEPWSGCAGEDGDRLRPGGLIYHDSLYFGPMLAAYELFSLSESMGIMLEDIDLVAAVPAIEIRPNLLRDHTKTTTRTRRQPIHPELMRLGFDAYIEELRRLGYQTLWPDLILRGQNTDLGDLFDKKWAPALDHALPQARSQNQTYHSWRKGGNSTLAVAEANGEITMVTRYQLLGHALKDVNGKHYTAPMPNDVKMAAIQLLPNVTAHLPTPKKIQLASSVEEFARLVPIDKRKFLI